MKSRKLHGEAGDADADAVERELPNLRLACDRYAKEDVWNADETGLNYAMPPDRTISQAAQPGRKKKQKAIDTSCVCQRDWYGKVSSSLHWERQKTAVFQEKDRCGPWI